MPRGGKDLQGSVIVGKYRLDRYLGGSDGSAVFLTQRQQESPRIAAIKLIPAKPERAEAQLSRWNLISKLSHPHLLQIFEAGQCQHEGEELLYLVMEYAEENLAQVLSIRALTQQETDEMLKATVETLGFLHNLGFVHGHIKPANILVAGEQLKLSSDGICRIGELNCADTGAYAPPEPLETAIAPTRDVWSLGVTMVQSLTQLLPVLDANKQSLTLPETLPPMFADVARKCLEPDPQRRCTLNDIAGHFQYKLPAPSQSAVTKPRAQVEQPVSRRQLNPVPARRNRYAAAAFVLVLLLTVFIGSAKLLNRRSSPQSLPPALVEPTAASETFPVAEPSLKPAKNGNKIEADLPSRQKPSTRVALKTASEVRNVFPSSSIESGTTPGSIRSGAAPAAGDSTPGKIIQQVLPDVPRNAKNTIRGTVRVDVRVRVDPAGNISGVNFISVGPSQYFARLASDAARRWKFVPAQRNGQAVASKWDLRFEFLRGGARVTPVAIP